jgi:ATP-dependent DNA ligase
LDVPGLGRVQITYELNTYARGRSRHWHWRAQRADLAPELAAHADKPDNTPPVTMGGMKQQPQQVTMGTARQVLASEVIDLGSIEPMRALDDKFKPFTDPDWIYEIKYDGYRMLASVDAGEVRLRFKVGKRVTTLFPEIRRALEQLPGGPHIIDGECCALDELGRSDFNRFRARGQLRRAGEEVNIALCCFDLLVHHGVDIMALPLVERKQRLATLMAGLPPRGALYIKDLPADAALFDLVLHLQLEGFMAKRKASPYTPGPDRSPDWRKLRRPGAVPAERFKFS